MLKLRSLKFLAVLASMGALLVIGATQTASLASKGQDAGLATIPCSGPSKVFGFGMAHQGADRVNGLKLRIAPEIDLAQLRFNPQPEEIIFNRSGLLELRFEQEEIARLSQIQVEVCNAAIVHEVREAYWIVRSNGQPVAQIVGADNIRWEWRENGENVVPGTQLASKEISCAGMPLVQESQLVSREQAICVKDPEALTRLTGQMNEIGEQQSSFFGKVHTLLFGSRKFEEKLNKLNAEMQKLYLYSPYNGEVTGITSDSLNGMTWIKLQVEETSKIMAIE